LIGTLLFASPTIGLLIKPPAGEQFSELYLLGQEHMAENYPFKVALSQNNSVFIGVTNHIDSSAYYLLYVKLKNQTDLYPNASNIAPNLVSPLYEYRFFAQNGENWVRPLNFSVSTATFSENQSFVKVLTINNVAFNINKSAAWDANSSRFPYQLFFELWMYNVQTHSIEYNNRYVTLQLNLSRNG
jgi:uncharacterized membrane protein